MDGQLVSVALARRDIGAAFRFLAARGFSRAAIGDATGLSESRVREISTGRRRVESYEVLERIATGLLIERGLLGLSYGPDAPSADRAEVGGQVQDPSSSEDFIGALAATAMGASQEVVSQFLPLASPGTAEVPKVVTATQISMLRAVNERHRQFDAEHGGGACRDSAAAYLAWAQALLGARCDSEDTALQLRAGLSDLHQVVGWASHDLGEHGLARRHLVAGLVLARQIDDLVLISGAFYRLGRISIHQGRAMEALKLWQLGQIVAQDSGCLVSVAVLHANEAWAYALLGAADRACDALARAAGELGRVEPASVPSWAQFFLAPADLDGLSAVAYCALATHPEHRARFTPVALQHAHRALELRRPGEDRSRTFDAISVATGYALDAQPDHVGSYGRQALELATAAESTRTIDRLQDLVAVAARYSPRTEATEVVASRIQAVAALDTRSGNGAAAGLP